MNDVTHANITAVKGHTQAVAFAIKGGKELSALLGDIATTKEMERRGPIQTFLFLETHFTEEESHAIPIVGSKMGETGNLAYDRYTVEVKTADGKRKVPGSWYTDAVRSTEEGQRILQRIEHLDAGQGDGIPEDILKLGSAQRIEEKVKLRQRLADMRVGLTKGAMLFHQVEEIAKINPDRIKVKLPFFEEKGGDGEPKTVVKGNLIRLQDPKNEYEDEVVTVGQFLQYDAEATAKDKDGGTIKSLKATAARAPRTVKPAGKAVTVPTNLNEGLTLFNVLSTWVDNTTPEGQKIESMLLAHMSKEGADSDETVESVGKLCLALDSIWTVIQPRFDIIQRRKAAAATTKVA